MSILDKLATVDEMADKWQTTSRTVRRWAESGKIEAKKLTREWVIVKDQNKPKKSEELK